MRQGVFAGPLSLEVADGGGMEKLGMPFFDADSVQALVGAQASADHTLDLRGMPLAQAQTAISRLLEGERSGGGTSVVVRIDPATATSGETLFLPVGRQLLAARKQGLVTRFQPLPEADGGGFYVELPG